MAANDSTSTRLEVGDRAPAFTLLDQHGAKVKLSDFKGRKVMIFFYPKANTPGCTTQACGLRDVADQIGDTAILGISQIAALAAFPLVSKFLKRRQIHLLATVLCLVGYVVFLLAGTSLTLVAVAGILLFTGQGAMQLLMVMFIADSVEYGHWKLGRRNESVTFSLQPFIYKLSNAIASGVVGATLILSGIDVAVSAADVTDRGAFLLRISMMVLPMVLMAVSYLVLRAKYKLDEEFYVGVIKDLEDRHGAQAAH